MKIKIGLKEIKDKSIEIDVLKSFEYFATINNEKAIEIEKRNNSPEIISLLEELSDYIEYGLKKKYSTNINIIISDSPNYAIKFEKGFLMSFSYLKYEIILFKIPYITIQSKFRKQELKEDQDHMNEKEKLNKILSENLIYNVKYYFNRETNNKIKNKSLLTVEFLYNLIINNIIEASHLKTIKNKNKEKFDFLCFLSTSIQYDLSNRDKEYNYGVVIGKEIVVAKSFIASSNLFFICEFVDPKRILKDYEYKQISNMKIMIYHKHCEFESPFKNILTGRFKSVELKHFLILISVIIFFSLIGFCKEGEGYYKNKEKLSFIEEKICLNKGSYLSVIGVLFIFIAISGVLKKKMKVNETKGNKTKIN